MKVSVIFWGKNGNCGDEAYKIAFPLLFPEHDFVFSATSADICLLGGGNILSTSFVKKALAVKAKKHESNQASLPATTLPPESDPIMR